MKGFAVNIDCSKCENKTFCEEGIVLYTKELTHRLQGEGFLDEILGSKILKGIKIIKYCALKIGDAKLSEKKSRVPKTHWRLCEHCPKKDICGNREIVVGWQARYGAEVEKDVNNPSISAPWIDSEIVCCLVHREQ